MQTPDQRMTEFIREHHVLTLATAENNEPYCCTVFYVFDESKLQFIFSSGKDTTHGKQLLKNPAAAGAIALETTMVGKIRGLQFSGTAQLLEGEAEEHAARLYTSAFPVAMLSSLTLWSLRIDQMKFTDNRLGFGKKIRWERTGTV